MNTLNKKIALVTGASKGIGAAIAKAFGAEGATVIVNYVTSEAGADKTVAAIVSAGGKAIAIQGDFSKEDDIVRVYDIIRETYGTLDVLVNNAGVYAYGPIEQVTVEEFQRQFGVNVLGLLLSSKAAVGLFGSDGGSIINIGSGVSRMSPPFSSIYSATKGAVDSITIALSKELGARKIRVNSLNPGLVATEGAESDEPSTKAFYAFLLNATPLGRIGQPEDIANVAVFLASDAAFWVNGQQIIVAGGQTM
jgi:3-oxoacyl-[acyl-carrier protein] reductase